jgi:glycosyltransferase involved in cell wall biosynthesis
MICTSKDEIIRLAAKQDRPKISVIIPVYNGGRYLQRTLDSLLMQQFKAFEVICIDDGSIDNSDSILKRFAAMDYRVRVFRTTENLGIVPKVLRFGTQYIRGDYYVYSSQDDTFSENWLECMYARAIETKADAIIPDLTFWYENEPSRNRILSGIFGDRSRVINGRDAFLLSLDWTIPGNALWKVWLIREIGYFDFGMNADEYTARFWFLNCSSIAFCQGVFYYRQDNPEAITKKISTKTLDLPYTELMLWKLARDSNFPVDVQAMILERSVFSLIYCSSLVAANKALRIEAGKLARCQAAYRDNNAHAFYGVMNIRSLRSLAVWLIIRSRIGFEIVASMQSFRLFLRKLSYAASSCRPI